VKTLELNSNYVNISDGGVIFCCSSDDCFRNVKVSVLGIEGAGSELSSEWRKPMPKEHDNTLSFRGHMIPGNG
jgi:hypothetical protein